MEAGGEECDGDGEGRLLRFCGAGGDLCRRHGDVRGYAVGPCLFLYRVLG